MLDKSIWGVEFYMLADRDAAPAYDLEDDMNTGAEGKFKTLGKYHLENYFLESSTLASCFEQMEEDDSWLRNPVEIDKILREIATEHIGYAAALIASKQVRNQAGNTNVMVKGAHAFTEEQLIESMIAKANQEHSRISKSLNQGNIQRHVEKTYSELDALLKTEGDEWKSYIPGKPVFAKFCAKANIPQGRLKTLYIQCAKESDSDPFLEIYEIFESFSK